jgi:putative ABC transport system permease protein
MSHAGLVWANLCRRPLQSLLSLACATVGFAIYGVLFGILDSFHRSGIQNATFEQQALFGAIVLSGIGMALILLLTASATAHSVRMRLYEFGVLKALGFSHRRIIALVIAEAAVPCMAGAALGLAAVPLLFAALAQGVRGLAMLPAPVYSLATLIGALGVSTLLAVLASILPALRIVRVDAAAALSGSAETAVPVGAVESRATPNRRVTMAASHGRRRLLASAGEVGGLLRQTLAVTRVGFSTLPQRARSAALIVGGVACTTFVLLWFLSMAQGIRSALLDSGDPARVVLRSSSSPWLGESRLPEGVDVLAAGAPGVARATDGSPLAEAVVHAGIWPVVRRVNGRPTAIDILGVGPHWREMTPSFRLLSGRLPQPGTHEVMVGHLAPRALIGLDGGLLKRSMEANRKEFHDVEWQVVGTFSTGDWHDGHLIGDIEVLRQYASGLSATAVFVRLDSPRSFDAFRSHVLRRLPPNVTVEREADNYAALWDAIPMNLLYVVSVLGVLLATGATLATMQVAHSALEARRREIATLRVLGFDGRAAALSILLEALPFALLGAWIGAGLMWLWRRGDLWAGAGSVFEIGVDFQLVLLSTGCAVLIAMIGTLPLAIRSLRAGEIDGLKDLREMEEASPASDSTDVRSGAPPMGLALAS